MEIEQSLSPLDLIEIAPNVWDELLREHGVEARRILFPLVLTVFREILLETLSESDDTPRERRIFFEFQDGDRGTAYVVRVGEAVCELGRVKGQSALRVVRVALRS